LFYNIKQHPGYPCLVPLTSNYWEIEILRAIPSEHQYHLSLVPQDYFDYLDYRHVPSLECPLEDSFYLFLIVSGLFLFLQFIEEIKYGTFAFFIDKYAFINHIILYKAIFIKKTIHPNILLLLW